MIVVDHSQLFGAMWIVDKGEGDRNTRLLYKYGNLAVSQIYAYAHPSSIVSNAPKIYVLLKTGKI